MKKFAITLKKREDSHERFSIVMDQLNIGYESLGDYRYYAWMDEARARTLNSNFNWITILGI